MAIVEKDGFKFLDGEMIVIEQDRIDDYIDYIIEKQIKSVYVCNLYFRNRDINFFKKIDFIEKININSTGIKNYDVLQCLYNLKSLIIEDPEGIVNLDHNMSLEELTIRMNKNVKGLDKLKNIKRLCLYWYNPKSKSLIELKEMSKLEELQIVGSSIESFKGCVHLKSLKKIELNYMRKLQYIDELEKLNNTLKILKFNCCKKIINHEYVVCLSNLEKLSFDECSDIKSIAFIKKMPNLKWFVFMNTNICDGNIDYCKGLEYVAFTNKRHFSHKLNDFRI